MSDPAQFVAKFVDFWKDPSPERLTEVLHDDVVLTQPLAAPMRGLVAAQDEFRKIWQLMPDMRAYLDRWAGDGDLLFVEFRLHATIGRRVVEWPNIDRFFLREGRAAARMNYFDPLAILKTMPPHPTVLRRWWSSGAARPWRSGHGLVDYPH